MQMSRIFTTGGSQSTYEVSAIAGSRRTSLAALREPLSLHRPGKFAGPFCNILHPWKPYLCYFPLVYSRRQHDWCIRQPRILYI